MYFSFLRMDHEGNPSVVLPHTPPPRACPFLILVAGPSFHLYGILRLCSPHFSTLFQKYQNSSLSTSRDWMGKYEGYSSLVLQPRTTQHVSDILRYCNERYLAVVPQGGNTGLVGGSVPVFDEIVLSTSELNKIIAFDSTAGVFSCQAG